MKNVGDLTCIQDHKSFILKNGDSYIHDEQTVKASIDVANYAKNYQRRQNARVSRSISTQQFIADVLTAKFLAR